MYASHACAIIKRQCHSSSYPERNVTVLSNVHTLRQIMPTDPDVVVVNPTPAQPDTAPVMETVFHFTANAIKRSSDKTELDQHFNQKYNEIERRIGFRSEWSNGTDYMEGAITSSQKLWATVVETDDELHLQFGEMAKSVDDSGRRIIIIGTRLGPVVVFERYTPIEGERNTYVFNTTTAIENSMLVPRGPVIRTIEDMEAFLGSRSGDRSNVGKVIETNHLNCMQYTLDSAHHTHPDIDFSQAA